MNGKAAPLLQTGQPGSANNDPLVQGIINILGTPGVILPAGEYADGTPFGVIVIGRFWDEANLLGLAYDYELASVGTSLARVVPTHDSRAVEHDAGPGPARPAAASPPRP